MKKIIIVVLLILSCNPQSPESIYPEWFDKAIIVTSVDDNLNASDGSRFIQKFKDLGYILHIYNTNTTLYEFQNYLKISIDTLYHTGHGNYGDVILADENANSYNSRIRVKNTIFATCLTLSDTSWAYSMQDEAKNLMGYTKISWDLVDDKIVDEYAKAVEYGYSPSSAWYMANAVFESVNDRWIVYTRELDGEIVEYSARNENYEQFVVENYSKVMDKVYVRTGLLKRGLFTFNLSYNPFDRVINDVNFKLNIRFKGLSSLKTTNMSSSDAVNLAKKQIIKSDLLNTELWKPRVFQILKREIQDEHHTVVGYSVMFVRMYYGLPIKSNDVSDHILVLVTEEESYVVSYKWSKYLILEDYDSDKILSFEESVKSWFKESEVHLKDKNLYIKDYYVVLGLVDDSLKPSYDVVLMDGSRIIISAVDESLMIEE